MALKVIASVKRRLVAWWTLDPETAALHAENYRWYRVFGWVHSAVVVEIGLKLGPVTFLAYLGKPIRLWRWDVPVPHAGITFLGRVVIDTGL